MAEHAVAVATLAQSESNPDCAIPDRPASMARTSALRRDSLCATPVRAVVGGRCGGCIRCTAGHPCPRCAGWRNHCAKRSMGAKPRPGPVVAIGWVGPAVRAAGFDHRLARHPLGSVLPLRRGRPRRCLDQQRRQDCHDGDRRDWPRKPRSTSLHHSIASVLGF